MATLMEKAQKGNKAALKALCDSSKGKVYLLSLLLTDDASKAGSVSIKAFKKAFGLLTQNEFQTEKQFEHFLLEEAAYISKEAIFKDNLKDFKTSSAKQTEYETAQFTGNAENGIEYLRKALKQLDRYQRFVSILAITEEFSDESIADITATEEANVKSLKAAALSSLKKALENGGPVWVRADAVRIENVFSLFKKAHEVYEVPANIDKAVNDIIVDNSGSKKSVNPKILIPSIISALVAVAIIIGVCFSMFNKTTSQKYIADIVVENYGTITVELDGTVAPITVENFVSIANSGFYNGLTFHRIIEGFMIQGGSPDGTSSGQSDHPYIKGEFDLNGHENPISHVRGTISMARSNSYNSASTQFFICHEDSTFLDGSYAAFGTVLSGMDIVDKICKDATPTDSDGTIRAAEQPKITSITIRQ